MVKEGSVLEFFHNKKIICVYCFRCDGKNLHCYTEDGKEHKFHTDKILSVCAADLHFDVADREHLRHYLRELSQTRQDLADSIALPDLWEICLQEHLSYRFETLAKVYFGSSCKEDELSAMFRALSQNKVYFKRKDNLYFPQSREYVDSILRLRQKEFERKEKQLACAAELSRIWSGQSHMMAPEFDFLLEHMIDVAVNKQNSSKYQDLAGLFSMAGIPSPDDAFDMLVKMGIFSVDENLSLRASGIEREIDGVYEQIAQDAVCRVCLDGYEDLTALDVFTIDDEKTLDIDDGISLEYLDDGYCVGIHITDVSAFIEPDSPLDLLARRRATSIYLPDLRIDMLPLNLCEQSASLVVGETRPVLSFLIYLDKQYRVVDFLMKNARIAVKRRLSYHETDTLIQCDETLRTLYEIALSFFQKRMDAGAFFLPFPRISLSVIDGKPIIKQDDPLRPSQLLVSEFMVFINQQAAAFCNRNEIPAIYRNQPKPDKMPPPREEWDFFAMYQMKRFLKKVSINVTSIGHFALGLAFYTQLTSPLRRYSDLLMQRQIKEFLRSAKPYYSRECLSEMICELDWLTDRAEKLERDRKQYWFLKHMESLTGNMLKALVLKVFPNHFWVQICENHMEWEVPRLAGMAESVFPGDTIYVIAERVVPKSRNMRLVYAGKTELFKIV